MSGSYQPFFASGGPAATDCCTPVAAPVATGNGFPDWGKGEDFRGFQRRRASGVAAVAAVAAPALPWSDGLRLLQRLARPEWVPAERWERLVYQAVTLSREWGEQVHALGWSTTDLFGCNPAPWARRLDRDGLALTLTDWCGPIRVRAVTAAAIVMEVDRGHRVRFYHHERLGSVPLWIGYAQEGGP